MRCFFAEDLGAYADKPALFGEFLNDNGNSVRNLAVERAQKLFADDLGGILTRGLIGAYVVGVKPFGFAKELRQLVHHLIDRLAVFGTDGYDRVKIELGGICRYRFCNYLTVVKVDLIERKHARNTAGLEISDDIPLDLRNFTPRIDHKQNAVAVLHRVLGTLYHGIPQLVLRAVNTGSVKKDILILSDGMDTHYFSSRRLRLA